MPADVLSAQKSPIPRTIECVKRKPTIISGKQELAIFYGLQD